MARNRIIYNALGLYVSTTGASGQQTGSNTIRQLQRVQSFDEDFSRNLTDVNQYGTLAAIDRVEVEAPTVNASFSYYVVDGANENFIGLTVGDSGTASGNLVSCISGLLSKVTDEKNYYLLIADEGSDANNYSKTNSGVIGIGNAFLTSYSVNAAVGDIPTASVDVEALNIKVYALTGQTANIAVPAVNPSDGSSINDVYFRLPVGSGNTYTNQIGALLPGDITLSIPTSSVLGFSTTDLKVQDFTLSFDLSRTPLQKLGTKFAFSREIDFPVTASLELNANVGDLQSGNLSDIICENKNYDFSIIMSQPGCGTSKPPALIYLFKQAKLISQNFTSTIGDNVSMTATFEVQLSAAEDKTKGIFISGSYDY